MYIIIFIVFEIEIHVSRRHEVVGIVENIFTVQFSIFFHFIYLKRNAQLATIASLPCGPL